MDFNSENDQRPPVAPQSQILIDFHIAIIFHLSTGVDRGIVLLKLDHGVEKLF